MLTDSQMGATPDARGASIATDPLSASVEPIAVCGMSLRLPGGISTPSQFWDLLVNKRDARSLIPESRFNADAYYSKSGKTGYLSTKHGYFLDESVDISALDATFFSMVKTEVERADPQQRLLLELTRECLESAGEANYRGASIGTYVGSFGEDWVENFAKDPEITGQYKITGYGDFVLSNRISYEYDLKGPSMTIRTGCSAALIGLHEACLAIRNGECNSALIGGCNLIMGPGLFINMCDQRVLSPNGSSRTFDAGADGYARGEAVNMIYVKKLSDAIRDGNPIRAVIRSTCINADGKTSGLSVPNPESHEAMIRRAYHVAGIEDFGATGFVECHGTGTQTGDPLEARAVANVFGGEGVYIGSVKPNVGHSEGAAGLTSLIKSILALEHQTIPPNIKFDNPNPKIPFEKAKLRVPVDATEWPQDRAERVSVNSFGIGGSNAHVILDSAKAFLGEQTASREAEGQQPLDPVQLLVFSANTVDSLEQQVIGHQNYLNENPSSRSDLSYTLAVRRQHHPHRAFSVVGDGIASNTSAFEKVPVSPPRVVMVFTGQGAQWARMGAELLASNPVFGASIRQMDKVLQTLPEPPTWTIIDELLKSSESSNLHKASISQPLCTAVQVGLVDALKDIGIDIYGVVGHSSGEMAAAYASKNLTSNEAIIAAYYRGVVSGEVTDVGAMAAIGMGRDDTSQFLIPGVTIACENSPSSVTISGDKDAVERVVEAIKEAKPDLLARLLKVDKAYHSHHMKQVGERYQSLASTYVRGNSETPESAPIFFSSVTGKQMSPSDLTDASYWRSNLECPVLFNTAVANFVSHHQSQKPQTGLIFLEVGPHAALAGPLRQILKQESLSYPYASCLSRGVNAAQSFLAAVGTLWQHHVPIDFNTLTNRHDKAKVLPDLPTYHWNHDQNHGMVETRLTNEWRFKKFSRHELLGSRVASSTDTEPLWRGILMLDHVPWIRDHNIKGDVIFPCAGYVAMVGEAARQMYLTSPSDGQYQGFAIRNLVVDTAMVLPKSKGTEIVTSLKRARLTDSLDSHWWEFVVSSHNGTSWSKHCAGQVCARSSDAPGFQSRQPMDNTSLSRKVDSAKIYQSFRNVGGNYGPYFQGLKDVCCSTTKHIAAGTAADSINDDETNYAVHPTKIDFFLQLFLIAKVKGVGHAVKKMMVPTFVGHLEARETQDDIRMTVETNSNSRSGSRGDGEGLNKNGEMVISMKNVKFSSLEGDNTADKADPHAGARVYWQADADFVKMDTLAKQIGDHEKHLQLSHELNLLCIQDSLVQLQDVEPSKPHLVQFLNWMKKQDLPQTTRTISSLVEELKPTVVSPLAVGVLKIHENIVGIFNGDVSPIELLMADDTLTSIYNIDFSDRKAIFQTLSHSKPNMRVLEVGAGTGGTTFKVLQGLVSPTNQPAYSSYTYTDISAGFFDAAKERFKDHQSMQFQTLDISKDPLQQGFEAESYDLIIAANVLHATPRLVDTLSRVRKLLHPEGRLYMEELCTDSKAMNFIMGVLPGWWLGEDDGRPDEPYVSPERWDEDLREAGFDGLEDCNLDGSPGSRFGASLTARPARDVPTSATATVLYDEASRDLAETVASLLQGQGIVASLHDLAKPLPSTTNDIVSVIDLHSPFFENIDADKYRTFQDLMNHLSELQRGIMWLTRASQVKCADPRWAQIIGASRSIRNELKVDIATCELEDMGSATLECAIKVFQKFQKRTSGGTLQPDFEWAITDGQVVVPRVYPVVLNEELIQSEQDGSSYLHDLRVGTLGNLSSLSWVARAAKPLVDDEVEVEAKAVGLNFRDVLCAMGIVDMPASKLGLETLGIEAGGVVKRVGPDVKDLKEGDRVFLITGGCFSTGLVVPAQLCVKIPDSLSFEDAATMPCVFATVIYALLEVARLEKGQSVLIHSACGGVGLAAIQICNMVGAEIYCTVGNENKIQYLENSCGISRDHIFNSRDASFLTGIMEATNGNGVDVVLNSLSGELLHTSWECVASFGRMIEIGKRDLMGNGKLDLNPFLLNRSYHGVDLTQITEVRPQEGQRLLKKVVQFYEDRLIKPLTPLKSFTADKVEDAFRYMQKGQHMGKIVVSMEEDETLSIAQPRTKPIFKSDASYILVGGLGGLGRIVSSWMVEHGARNLVYLSRNAGANTVDESYLEELRSQGCTATTIQGSVTSLADVEKAVAAAPSPVKGILNMSMVLRDQGFSAMSAEDWSAVVDPKVQGTWNLHNACKALDADLDFFVLFSSISGLIGQKGQANYASANTFLDAFVQYRRNLGLNASVVDIGMMIDHGYVADKDVLRERMAVQGYYGIMVNQLLDAITATISKPREDAPSDKPTVFSEPSQIAIGMRSLTPLSDPSNQTVWKRDRRLAIYHNSQDASAGSSNSKADSSNALAIFIASAMGDPAILFVKDSGLFVARQIAMHILTLLLRPVDDESEVDVSRSLQDIGLDSLVAIELRAWWRTTFGFDISMLEMLGMGSVLALGERAIEGLKERFSFDEEANGSKTA
ncbi:hypothetical protein G7Z17_g1229 [Cylindrodendrum hubeiense]|uniref:Polyketide synthase n=1 Tax=Cylindrodendrum hubeiense TaxID=595255 RepID=A0A9P5HF64_9HYPO|nr:hypothetical protein G7Z17_g1229 [Cylindrodendrum hubeiense]